MSFFLEITYFLEHPLVISFKASDFGKEKYQCLILWFCCLVVL